MTTNTTTQPTDIIRKTTLNGRTVWAFDTQRRFTNHRLVKHGGPPYNDIDFGTGFYKTRKAAVESIEKMTNNGWTLTSRRMFKDTTTI